MYNQLSRVGSSVSYCIFLAVFFPILGFLKKAQDLWRSFRSGFCYLCLACRSTWVHPPEMKQTKEQKSDCLLVKEYSVILYKFIILPSVQWNAQCHLNIVLTWLVFAVFMFPLWFHYILKNIAILQNLSQFMNFSFSKKSCRFYLSVSVYLYAFVWIWWSKLGKGLLGEAQNVLLRYFPV
jgi:hypothetical protein